MSVPGLPESPGADGRTGSMGDRYEEAIPLTNLGDTLHAANDIPAAEDNWQHALQILTDLNHPDAKTIGTRLESVRRSTEEINVMGVRSARD
jgi:hypothetical protein